MRLTDLAVGRRECLDELGFGSVDDDVANAPDALLRDLDPLRDVPAERLRVGPQTRSGEPRHEHVEQADEPDRRQRRGWVDRYQRSDNEKGKQDRGRAIEDLQKNLEDEHLALAEDRQQVRAAVLKVIDVR